MSSEITPNDRIKLINNITFLDDTLQKLGILYHNETDQKEKDKLFYEWDKFRKALNKSVKEFQRLYNENAKLNDIKNLAASLKIVENMVDKGFSQTFDNQDEIKDKLDNILFLLNQIFDNSEERGYH